MSKSTLNCSKISCARARMSTLSHSNVMGGGIVLIQPVCICILKNGHFVLLWTAESRKVYHKKMIHTQNETLGQRGIKLPKIVFQTKYSINILVNSSQELRPKAEDIENPYYFLNVYYSFIYSAKTSD